MNIGMHSDDLMKIYSEVCKCDSEKCRSFPEIYNSPINGSPPRGFYTEPEGNKKILIVGKNPGHVLPSEAEKYRDVVGEDLVRAHMQFSKDTFLNLNKLSSIEKRSTKFHSNLISYLIEITECSKEEVFQKVVYTNLVKCSTQDEQGILTQRVMIECFYRHLINEIKYFQPSLIFALGREVEKFLNLVRSLNGFEFEIAYIKHPSYFYNKQVRAGKINELKALYKRHNES